MVYGMIFYIPTKDTDYKIYHTKDNKYVTKIQKVGHKSYYKEWDYLIDAESYIIKKKKEVEIGGRDSE